MPASLWSDGGPFLCVEPCWGLTDHHEQRAFEDKQASKRFHREVNCAPLSAWLRNLPPAIDRRAPGRSTHRHQSQHKGNDAFGAVLVSGISLRELLEHQFFFTTQFNPETRKHE
jgi:hypothetical protein